MITKKIPEAAVARVEQALSSDLRTLAASSPMDIRTNFAEILRTLATRAVEAVQAGAEIVVPVTGREAQSFLGEAIHTGLRRGTDAEGSHAAWKAVAADNSGWGDAIEFALEGLQRHFIIMSEREA